MNLSQNPINFTRNGVWRQSHKMILQINTAEDNLIKLFIFNNEKLVAEKEEEARYQQSEKLLVTIDELLKDNNIDLKQITKIRIENKGDGFSSLRIGVVTANALGYALNIPVEGLSTSSFKDNDFSIVRPEYGGEPNIT